jgi:hypothetical protein
MRTLILEDKDELYALMVLGEQLSIARDEEMIYPYQLEELDLSLPELVESFKQQIKLIWNRIPLKQQPHRKSLPSPGHSRQGPVLASIKCLRI